MERNQEELIENGKGLNVFEKYLTVWAILCIAREIAWVRWRDDSDGCRRADKIPGYDDADQNLSANAGLVQRGG